MTAFTRHPCQQGLTYFGQGLWASGIAGRRLASVLAFLLHAGLPFMTIQPRLDLEATSTYLLERNHFIETTAATTHGQDIPERTSSKSGRHDTPVLA